MADVVCLGQLVADVVAKPVDALPPRGGLSLLGELRLHTGGSAANTGVVLAKLGISAGVIGKVGQDLFGDFVINQLAAFGLEVTGIVRTPAAQTSTSLVLVDSRGERSFLQCLGANATLGPEDLDWRCLEGAKILHVAGSLLLPSLDGEPLAQILARARARGIITTLDTVWDPSGRWLETLATCLPHLDVFLPSYAEAAAMTGEREPARIAAALLAYGVGMVVLKLGEEGCYLAKGREGWHLPAFPLEAVDTNGAGDAFVGGFLAALCLGWDFVRAGRLGNAVGGMCVTALGSTAGIVDLATTLAWMEAKENARADCSA